MFVLNKLNENRRSLVQFYHMVHLTFMFGLIIFIVGAILIMTKVLFEMIELSDLFILVTILL